MQAGNGVVGLGFSSGPNENGFGGLVRISDNSTGHVSVVGSTLTNITVRAHC